MSEGLGAYVVGLFLALVQMLGGITPTPTHTPQPVVDPPRFPVVGAVSFGATHHDYPATDIFAACGSPVVAPVDGVVLEVGRRDRWDPLVNAGATRGGRFVSIEGTDGVRYYGSHLRSVRRDLRRGTVVRAGDRLGRVGRSGDARPVGCHLHFGLSPLCGTGQGDDWWIRRGVVSPYRFLVGWQRGTARSPARAVRLWQRAHGCPTAPLTDP
jgi:murein DD-endopeptidase MepM/ murein hydrolase activator NlpD